MCIGKRSGKRSGTRHAPVSETAVAPLIGLAPGNAQRQQIADSRSRSLPLLPSHLAQPPAEPAVGLLKDRGGVGQCEVRAPSDNESVEQRNPPRHRNPPASS